MKKIRKLKFLSIILASIMLFNTASMNALAVSDTAPEGQYLETTLDENTDESYEQEPTDAPDDSDEQPSATDADESDDVETPAEDELQDDTNTDTDIEEPAQEQEDPVAESEQEDSEAVVDEEENEASAEDAAESETADDIFPGLGEDYVFTAQQLSDKATLAKYRCNGAKYDPDAEYPDNEDEYVLGEVVYLAETEDEAIQVAEAFGGTLETYSYEVATIKLPKSATVARAIAAAADSETKLPAVWPNGYAYAYGDAAEENEVSKEIISDDYQIMTARNLPNDPALKPSNADYQWQHDYIGDTYAWAKGYKGQGVKVAIIDTGLLTTHEDLSAHAVSGRDFVGGKSGVAFNGDHKQHGSHVSGIVGANQGNGKGGAGIAPEAIIRGYAVLGSDGSGTDDDIVRAINAAVQDGNDIINMSLGGVLYSALYETVLSNAYEKGVAVFAAAGNDATSGWAYPACYNHVISVGALNNDGTRASFSNYGSMVDLSFPGVGIYSTIPTSNSAYGYMSGTSQACPAAAGTAAVIFSADSELKATTGGARVDALLKKMQSAARKSASPNMGAGTTYLPKLLQLATDETIPATPVIQLEDSSKSTYDTTVRAYRAASVSVRLSSDTPVEGIVIYYSTDGKSVTYKNGAPSANARTYNNASIPLTGAKKVSIKAIAVNPRSGKVSKMASADYTLAPTPSSISVTSIPGITQVVAGKSVSLKADIAPTYAISTKVDWSIVEPNAAEKGISVSTSGVVKTTAGKTTAGTYHIKATAVGADGKTYNGVSDTFTLSVIDSSSITKMAFIGSDGKALNKVSLNVSDTYTLGTYLKVNDSNSWSSGAVVWTSSNSRVASVDNTGKITARAPGQAVIKAVSNDGMGKNASCTVTVLQPVTGITLSGPSVAAVGKSIKITAKVWPTNASNQKLNWTSSDKDKAPVSGGKVSVKAGASGNITITATAQDGSGATGTWTFTVSNTPITSITLPNEQKKITLFSTSGYSSAPTSFTLTPTVRTSNDSSSAAYEYTSSAPAVASVNRTTGTITARAPGKATITCISTDGTNKKATCSVNVNVPMSSLALIPTGYYWDYGRGTATLSTGEGRLAYLAVGKTITLKAVCGTTFGMPTNKKLNWKSSDETVVKVKNGKITAVKKLENIDKSAYIYAEAADGSHVRASIKIDITPSYNKLKVEKLSGGAMCVVGQYKVGRYTYSDYILGLCKIDASGMKNLSMYIDDREDMIFFPIPNEATTQKTSSSALTKKDYKKITMKVTILDGSNKSVTCTQYVCKLKNSPSDSWYYRWR